MHTVLSTALLLIASCESYGQNVRSRQLFTAHGRPVTVTMGSLRAGSRPLLVFAPSDTSPQLVEQIRLLTAGSNDLRERQVVVVPVVEGGDQSPGGNPLAGKLKMRVFGHLKSDEAASTREHFNARKGEFTVVLVGKDGGEKFRTHAPVTIEMLNALIDAMPMRQQEERDGHAK